MSTAHAHSPFLGTPVSISCTFDGHHSCGYAGVSRISPWKRGNASQIQNEFTWTESFRLNVPLSDHKYNTSGKFKGSTTRMRIISHIFRQAIKKNLKRIFRKK